MNTDDQDRSLGDAATFAGSSKRRPTDASLGDERTLGGGDAAGLDAVIDDIEVVDLEARYTIEGTLGQGGMGAVMLALDTRLDRKVAIKRILGEAARSKTAIQRFLTEAKAIAALNHPNIVQIYDYGRAKDGPFLIMEYVDGGSVADRCKQGAMPLDETVSLACQICDGLAKAHDAGIVHRDIKPANVLLNRDGHPKLTDFGLAKAETADHGMTMAGAVMGTPDFMPPEQRRDASEVDHRSDLWSLAATVYQMATGRSPKIIRFDLLPAELTKVLGKALEEEKEARYQSVREFRDALKTTVRVAAVAVHDAVEGACVACGVQNDPSRKFCKGCGESLLAPCLGCGAAAPIWDEICGACGAKQTPLADERRRTMAARQAEAEGLLGDFEFDRAAALAAELRAESHPKLKHLSGWATTFLEQTEKARTEQIAKAVEAVRQATKHEAAHDHHAAVAALETVPASLAEAVLPGLAETARRMLDRIRQKQGEIGRLERLIKERIAAKQLDELLPDVEKLLVLQPDRKDVRKIRGQLVERAERQAAARDEAVATAKAALANHDYEAACATLSGVAGAATTSEVVSLREQAEGLVRQVRSLGRAIRDAVAANQLDGLLTTANRYLELKPGDAEVTVLRQSLVERETKIATEITARLEQARSLEAACQFDEAAKLLTVIPQPRRSAAVVAAIDRAGQLSSRRQAALSALSRAGSGSYAAAISGSSGYRDAIAEGRITDQEFSTLFAKAEAAHAEEVQWQRRKSLAIKTGAAIAAGIAVVLGGLWLRSSAREAALVGAIKRGRWAEALAMDPFNPQALVGRARSELTADPADIEGAFADIEQASRQPGSGVIVKAARAEAHAARAAAEARAGRLDRADEELQTAMRGGASQQMLAPAKTAIAAAWLARAEQAVARGDGAAIKTAADKAAAAVVSLPPAALASLPPAALASLPPAALASLPPAALASLPPAAILKLPPLRNSIGMELKLLPAGAFTMGQAGGESDETPHQVTLTKPFYLGVTEVTNSQWQAVMRSMPSKWKEADRPVEQLSWEDANEFCRKLSAFGEERQAGRVYRLPTEAEWEYACRAGTKTRYCFGDNEVGLGDFGWFEANAGGETHPVGGKKPNAWGLFDMHGNVWEWCSDWYGEYPTGVVSDPQGPSGGPRRVYRGGGWSNSAGVCRSASRSGFGAAFRGGLLGFRLALSSSGAQSVLPEAALGSDKSAPRVDGRWSSNGNEFTIMQHADVLTWTSQDSQHTYSSECRWNGTSFVGTCNRTIKGTSCMIPLQLVVTPLSATEMSCEDTASQTGCGLTQGQRHSSRWSKLR